MAATKEVYSSLHACKGPPILMGDDSPIEVAGKGRGELLHGSFEDVLHVPKLSVNLLSVYESTHFGTEKRVEFTLDAVNIYDLHRNSKSATGKSYAEATGHPSWESSMEEEYNSLLENQTWDLVPLPPRRKLVRCKWVYRTKSVVDGQITRQKARLVAKGFEQVHGIDYDETFAPVENMDSIRLALAIATA
eukprot:PITA_02418